MSDLPTYLQRLDEALFDLPEAAGGMLLSEVDGFLTGIALSPVAVPSEEWLPLIWRSNPETPDYLYHDQALLAEIEELARQHHRMLARDLHKGELAPIYDVDPRRDETLWEFWIAGFGHAMDLRPEAFAAIDMAPNAAKEGFGGLFLLSRLAETGISAALGDAALGDKVDGPNAQKMEVPELKSFSPEDRQALVEDAPDLIPEWVQNLYDWTRSFRPTPDFAVPVRSAKIGRNDPCPCGSGKKYKKCCGAAA